MECTQVTVSGRNIEIEFGFLILESNGVIGLDLDRTQRVPRSGNGKADAQEIAGVNHRRGEHQKKYDAFDGSHVSLNCSAVYCERRIGTSG